MSGYRIDRSLLLNPDSTPGLPTPPLQSIKDATWEHQAYAMSKGYKSVAELAIDELAQVVRELVERMDRVERQIAGLADSIQTLHARTGGVTISGDGQLEP